MCLYVKSNQSVAQILAYSNSTIECIVLKNDTLNCIMCALYRPSDTRPEEWKNFIQILNETINMAQAHGKYSNLHILWVI